MRVKCSCSLSQSRSLIEGETVFKNFILKLRAYVTNAYKCWDMCSCIKEYNKFLKSWIYKVWPISIAPVTLSTLAKIVLFWFVVKLASVAPMPFSATQWSSECESWNTMIGHHVEGCHRCYPSKTPLPMLSNCTIYTTFGDLPSPSTWPYVKSVPADRKCTRVWKEMHKFSSFKWFLWLQFPCLKYACRFQVRIVWAIHCAK